MLDTFIHLYIILFHILQIGIKNETIIYNKFQFIS